MHGGVYGSNRNIQRAEAGHQFKTILCYLDPAWALAAGLRSRQVTEQGRELALEALFLPPPKWKDSP